MPTELPTIFNYLYFSTYVNETITYPIVYKQINIVPISLQTGPANEHTNSEQWNSQLVQIISPIKIDRLLFTCATIIGRVVVFTCSTYMWNKKNYMDNTLWNDPYFIISVTLQLLYYYCSETKTTSDSVAQTKWIIVYLQSIEASTTVSTDI